MKFGLPERVFRVGVMATLGLLAMAGSAQSWTFAYMSDHRAASGMSPGVNTGVVANLAADIAANHAELLLVGGDLIIGNYGNVAEVVTQYNNFKSAIAAVTNANIPVYPVPGNHEFQCSTNDVLTQYEIGTSAWAIAFGQTLPQNGPAGDEGMTYGFEHENALFLGLNQWNGYRSYKGNDNAWVAAQLAASTQTHVFAFGHNPMAMVEGVDAISNRNDFWSLLGQAGARMYFCGHEHCRARTLTRTPDADRNFIYEVTDGRGGAPSGPPLVFPDPNDILFTNLFYNDSNFGYTLVNVDGPVVTCCWRYYEDTGTGLVWHTTDEFTYGHNDYSNTIREVSALVSNQVTDGSIVGLSIALIDGQRVVWQSGFGMADVERGIAAATDTVYRIGSCSKSFTAIGILQLWEDSLVDLEGPVTNYLADFSLLPRFTNDTPITLRMLLNHHSGMPGDMFNGMFTMSPWSGFSAFLRQALAADYPTMPPNTINSYNNSAYVLAGDVIAAASGQTFPAFMQSRILGPLGMNSSSFLPDKAAISNLLARSYMAGELQVDEAFNGYATGGMYSSVPDLARFVRMLLARGMWEGSPLLGTNAVLAMIEPQGTNLPLNVGHITPGLGWDAVRDGNLDYAGRVCCKDGATLFQCGFVGWLPDQKLGVVVLQNSDGSQCDSIGIRALQWATLDKIGLHWITNFIPPVSPVMSRPQAELDAMAGFYAGSGYHRVVAESDSLTLVYNAHLDSPTIITNLVPRSNGWFSVISDSPAIECIVTNIGNRILLLAKTPETWGQNTSILGERVTQPVFSETWSNRLDRLYVVRQMHPDDLLFAYPGSMTLTLAGKDGFMLVQGGQTFLAQPTNDSVAFVAGLPNRHDNSVRFEPVAGNEWLSYASYRYQDIAHVPDLTIGAETNGAIPVVNGVAWFRFNAVAGATYGVRVGNPPDIMRIRIFDSSFNRLSYCMSNSLDWTCVSNGVYYLALATETQGSFDLRMFRHMIRGFNDYDGDGCADLAVYDPGNGLWYIRTVAGASLAWAVQYGGPGFDPVPGDYNGDGRTELAVQYEAAGFWYARTIEGANVLWQVPWGAPGLSPIWGDYDGDGRCDLAVNGAGAWYIQGANGTNIVWARAWGGSGLTPVPGDYDGDGIEDLAVYHQSSGLWYIMRPDGTLIQWACWWGASGLTPVWGDYDGDGISDLALYDQGAGRWYIVTLQGRLLAWGTRWGGAGFVPVPGDYNGDGASELAVYDQSNGVWYIGSVTGQILNWAIYWGAPTLMPVGGIQ